MNKPLPTSRSAPDKNASTSSTASPRRGESNYGYPNHQDGIQSGDLSGQQHEDDPSQPSVGDSLLPKKERAIDKR